VNNF
jgi:hypothetical protein